MTQYKPSRLAAATMACAGIPGCLCGRHENPRPMAIRMGDTTISDVKYTVYVTVKTGIIERIMRWEENGTYTVAQFTEFERADLTALLTSAARIRKYGQRYM